MIAVREVVAWGTDENRRDCAHTAGIEEFTQRRKPALVSIANEPSVMMLE